MEDSEVDNDQQLEVNNDYDVIIYGTGVGESLLACSLARNGKRVLHLDSNDFYGCNESSHTLQGVFDLAKANIQYEYKSNIINIDNNEKTLLFQKKSLFKTLDIKPLLLSSDHNDIEYNNLINKLQSSGRRCNIDFPNTSLIFSSGSVVDSIIQSDVSNYLEFQAIQGIYYAESLSETYNVPCSKGDVFKSNLLSVVEKRSLMKFLQVVSDWGRERHGINVDKLNEMDLALGRSLHRPQNKDTSDIKAQLDSFSSIENMSFHELMSLYQLSPKLQSIIHHALCLYSSPISIPIPNSSHATNHNFAKEHISSSSGLHDLYKHLISLGRFGDGAFLTPMYGIGELSQSFCRMCAVWGGIYILRQGITSVSWNMEDHNDKITIKDSLNQEYTCKLFICDGYTLDAMKPKTSFILSYIGIFSNALLPLQRSLTIIPAESKDIKNTNAIYLIQLDSSTNIVSEDFYYLSISTQVDYHEVETLEMDKKNIQMMKTIINKLLLQANTKSPLSTIYELCNIITLQQLYDVNEDFNSLHPNIYTSFKTTHSIVLDDQFDWAKNVFTQAFPDEIFLKTFKEVTREERDDEDDEDNEFKLIEDALNSIQQQDETSQL